MKKYLIFASVILAGCTAAVDMVSFERTDFYELNAGEQTFYFEYPQGGRVVEDRISFDGCEVFFGTSADYFARFTASDRIDEKVKNDDGKVFRAWYRDDMLVHYSGEDSRFNYSFWTEKDPLRCLSMIDYIAYSFTDQSFYRNEKYGFKAKMLAGFKVTQLPSGEGVVMKRVADVPEEEIDPEEENPVLNYTVEIGALAQENYSELANLSDFIAQNYNEHSFEFFYNGSLSGVYVDEGRGSDAYRHFFVMDEGGDYIYQLYLKLPSQFYSKHKDGFDSFVESFDLL